MPAKDLHTKFLGYREKVNGERLYNNTCNLTALELPQDSRAQIKSAGYAAQLLRDAGAENVEFIPIAADGKSCYLDKTMPMGWEAESGRLSILSAPEETAKGEVIADYEKHPFHLVYGSIATPEGGLNAPLVTEKDFLKGADIKGAFVLLEEDTWPRRNILTPVLDKGGIGLISSFLRGGDLTPDNLQWVTASTEGRQWHIIDTDRDFISWSISPNQGRRLRLLAEKGPIMLHCECNAKRCISSVPIVTGIIPGKKKEEVWLSAHLYEPLIDDDSSGVATVIETFHLLKAQGTPEYTIRAIFAMELYGFAAYAARFPLPLREKVLGGCNFDGSYAKKVQCVLSGTANAFYGNAILRLFCEENKGETHPEIVYRATGKYFDDISLSDPTVGVNQFWPLVHDTPFWHNSIQNKDMLDMEYYKGSAALNITLIDALANPDMALAERAVEILTKDLASYGEKAKKYPSPQRYFSRRADNMLASLKDFARPLGEAPDTTLFEKEAERILSALPEGEKTLPGGPVYSRACPGLPNDLRKFPLEKRNFGADFLYGAFSHILANMDGKSSLEELIERASYEEEIPAFSKEEKDHFYFVAEELAKYGYLNKE